MPKGLGTPGALCRGTGVNAATKRLSAIAPIAMHATGSQRRDDSRPSGKSRNTNTSGPSMGAPLAQVAIHALICARGNESGLVRASSVYPSLAPTTLRASPATQKSQPMTFSGRREATKAPTVEKASCMLINPKPRARSVVKVGLPLALVTRISAT
jgi:hypothetical protein